MMIQVAHSNLGKSSGHHCPVFVWLSSRLCLDWVLSGIMEAHTAFSSLVAGVLPSEGSLGAL